MCKRQTSPFEFSYPFTAMNEFTTIPGTIGTLFCEIFEVIPYPLEI
jgi:hypothetical protein